MEKAYFNWSGGKDSALALYHTIRSNEVSVQALFSVFKADCGRIAMHETGTALMERQAEAIGIPLVPLYCDTRWTQAEYAAALTERLERFKARGIRTALFGDLYFEELRNSREEACGKSGFKAGFPLWGTPKEEIMSEFLRLGFKAVVTCADASTVPVKWLGRVIDEEFVKSLPAGMDICGENGEYHSFVFDGPIFSHPVPFQIKGKYDRAYPSGGDETRTYWYLQLE